MQQSGLTEPDSVLQGRAPQLFCLPGPCILSDRLLAEAVMSRLELVGVLGCMEAGVQRDAGQYGFSPACPRPLAVAQALEAALKGMPTILCAGPGRKGGAPLEQVAAALYFAGFQTLPVPEIVQAVKDIHFMAGIPIPAYAPVIGERIFHVGTGIHVDGLLKDTRTYEPWDPEWLGHKRVFTDGRLSGQAAAKIRKGGSACRFA
jgi:hypothetical protein